MKNPKVAEVQWLSTADAAASLGLALRTLYRLIDEGEITAYKFGRVIRLTQADIDTYREAQRVEPGSLRHLYEAERRNPPPEPS